MGRCQNVALPTLSPKGQLSIVLIDLAAKVR